MLKIYFMSDSDVLIFLLYILAKTKPNQVIKDDEVIFRMSYSSINLEQCKFD